MRRQLWNDGWSFRPKPNLLLELTGQSGPWLDVVVPHDAMVTEERSATEGTAATAFHRGGTYEYRKPLPVPDDLRGKRVLLQFDGVYRDAHRLRQRPVRGAPAVRVLAVHGRSRPARALRLRQRDPRRRARQRRLTLVLGRRDLPRRLARRRRPGSPRARRSARHDARHRRRARGRRGRVDRRERLRSRRRPSTS